MAPSVGGDGGLDHITVLQVRGVLLELRGQESPEIHVTLGGDAVQGQCGAHRGSVNRMSLASSFWNFDSACSACTGGVEDVALDDHVLAYLAVDRQPQPQLTETLEFLGVDQHQRRPDRGEGGIGLRLEELLLVSCTSRAENVVGDHQAHHEIGQVGGGDLGAHGQLAAEDQTDLELVVHQLHMRRLDDVAERPGDRPGSLAEEGQRGLGGVAADVFDMRREVGGR